MFNNIRQMKVDSKYTLAGFNYLGSPYNVQMILKDLRCVGFEHGNDVYDMLYKKVKTKALCRVKLSINKQFIIWEGLETPDTQITVATFIKDGSQGAVQMLKRWRDNSPKYMYKAELSVSKPPLVVNYKPVVQDDRLFDLCEVIS